MIYLPLDSKNAAQGYWRQRLSLVCLRDHKVWVSDRFVRARAIRGPSFYWKNIKYYSSTDYWSVREYKYIYSIEFFRCINNSVFKCTSQKL